MKKKKIKRGLALLLTGAVALSLVPSVAMADTSTGKNVLQNGGFESWNDAFHPTGWSTTATDHNSSFERFSSFNSSSDYSMSQYGGGTLKTKQGKYAIELNYYTESTVYQVVDTTPNNFYRWGLSHGARWGRDALALIVGPNQQPVKTSESGNDQFMRMAKWIYENPSIYDNLTKGQEEIGKLNGPYTVYCKEFDGSSFKGGDTDPFSATKDANHPYAYTVWIMVGKNGTDVNGNNPWYSYGLSTDDTSNFDSACTYRVPTGQDQTIFAFVSVYSAGGDSVGNFLDDVRFELYKPVSVATTTNGNVTVSTLGTVTSEDSITDTYVKEGDPLTFIATTEPDGDEGATTLAGLYQTETDTDGRTTTKFVQVGDTSAGGTWEKEVNEDGTTTYTYKLPITKATDIQFVFLKSGLTYDANGGTYQVSSDSDANYVSFTPEIGEDGIYTFAEPYTSHAPSAPAGQEGTWKFVGWQAYDANGLVNNGQLFNASHTVANDYKRTASDAIKIINTASDATSVFEASIVASGSDASVKYSAADGYNLAYNNAGNGLTFVAQWKWLQSFTSQELADDGNYYDNTVDGTEVWIGDENVTESGYFIGNGESVTLKASSSNADYTFDGWYDDDGNLLTTSTEYTITGSRDSVASYHPRYTNKTTEDRPDAGTVYFASNESKYGSVTTKKQSGLYYPVSYASSEAVVNEGYTFLHWVDEDGNVVETDDNVKVNGTTLNVKICDETKGKTYTAVFTEVVNYTVESYFQNADGSFNETPNGTTTLQAVPGSTPDAAAIAESFKNFTVDPDASVMTEVNADGTTVVKLYYNRNKYTVSYDYGDGTVDTSTNYYETTVSPEDPSKADSRFYGWALKVNGKYVTDDNGNRVIYAPKSSGVESKIPVTENMTLEAQWSLVNTEPVTAYKVEHYKLRPDGTYLLDETEWHYAEIGTSVEAEKNSYIGYWLNTDKSVTEGTVEKVTTNENGEASCTTLALYYDCRWKSDNNDSGSSSSGRSHSSSSSSGRVTGSGNVGPGYEGSGDDTTKETTAAGTNTDTTKADTENGTAADSSGETSAPAAVDTTNRDANPKTGDSTKTAMWFSFMGISLAGLMVSGIAMKKKKEEN